MNAFVGKCRFIGMLVAFVLFAFAKASSQSGLAMTSSRTISIDQNTSRADLINLLNSLRTEQQMEVKLISYKRSDDLIKKLGLNLTDVEGKVSEFETDGYSGIPATCISINTKGTVTFLGLCNSSGDAMVETQNVLPVRSLEPVTSNEKVSEPENTEAVSFETITVQDLAANRSRQQELEQLRLEASRREQERLEDIQRAEQNILSAGSLEPVASNEKVSEPENTEAVSIETKTVQDLAANRSRQQELEQMRLEATRREQERLEDIQRIKSEKAAEKINILEDKQEQVLSDVQSMKDQQIAVRAELKALENENNRIKRERKTLDYNNKIALAKRDSLQQHQERLAQKIELETAQLEATIVAQQKANEVILRQNQVIEEQGLLAETAEGIKAYRTALLGNPENDVFKMQGYLFFAAAQCSYKVYEGYTIVYDSMGKVMFSIDKELIDSNVSGELKIKGRIFDYLFQSNFLIVKNKRGKLVNENGDALDGSVEEIEEIPFVVTHNFTIRNTMSPRELLAIKTDMGTLSMNMELVQENRNDGGVLTDLDFVLQGREYEFHGENGIPQIRVEVDQPNALSRVTAIQ